MNANIVHTIPDTFCPAKWDEIHLNVQQDYVFSCCKATPIRFYKNINQALNTQKNNLLTGIQDPSCNYCWATETGLRHEYLSKFDPNKFEHYKTNTVTPTLMEINLGNECNFQCLYCNPKFSSQWEQDVRKKPYRLFVDKFNYEIVEVNRRTTSESNLSIINEFQDVKNLNVIGGEPLLNKNLWQIFETTSATSISLVTNLSCDAKQLDKLFALHDKFEKIIIGVSIDATKEISEFVRYGLNFNTLIANLTYIFEHAPGNVHLNILSLMTSLTVLDLENFTKLVEVWKTQFPKLNWVLSYCVNPEIQGFKTLTENDRQTALKSVQYIKTLDYVSGIDSVEGALANTKFNNTLFQQMRYFVNEFATRKQIEKPTCLN